MRKTVDEHLVKISMSKIPIEETLELGQDVNILVKGTVTKVSQEDNNDGSYNQVYIIKGAVAEV